MNGTVREYLIAVAREDSSHFSYTQMIKEKRLKILPDTPDIESQVIWESTMKLLLRGQIDFVIV